MNSCLYECKVIHRRLSPKVHNLEHSLFMFLLDLDELDAVAKRLLFFSHNRKNLYSFQDADHQPAGAGPLKTRLFQFLAGHGIHLGSADRAVLLTLPRVAGYIFNPISVYFCFSSDQTPICSVAEVGNTFGEKKLYLLGPECVSSEAFKKRTAKMFYVSPFSKLDLDFDFNLRIPSESLDLRVDDFEGEQKTLISILTGRRAPLNNRTLLWFSVKYPLVTLKVIFLIHWHAFRLWRKGAPLHRKTDNPHLQTEVLTAK